MNTLSRSEIITINYGYSHLLIHMKKYTIYTKESSNMFINNPVTFCVKLVRILAGIKRENTHFNNFYSSIILINGPF